ncbi:MAG: 50S ribosomal protein L15 [Planctomycetaceae bacterium]|jgi:large subunit ribosomal protein L15|nr:50S ribosomal protein L15 [Planctomycetaceae bacterium]MBT6153963.1 50S ribosomal protein L15 [Planctomycetaceae bacterium]MBT6483735.1 50S ribosomal protein L15 [Planctomycetaceae bacterium]MBT6497001.1 50S ribosomal protein L15 [Planctomycetaceae bacterium]
MILSDVHQGIHKNRDRKRIGRGPGSGHGKTSGRGHKGYYSRSGSSRRIGYEGGQMPLARRIAKRGFSNARFAAKTLIFNLDTLDKAFEAGDTVSPESLAEKGLAKGTFDVIKILGNGELTKKLTVTIHGFSASAEEKIVAAGGTVERISAN